MAQSMWEAGIDCDGDSAETGSGLVLGIDFGSSNSSVAVWRADKNRVKIIRNKSERAAKVTPSVMQFTEGFKAFKIGHECDEDADNVISGLKAVIMGQDSGAVKGPTGWTDAFTVTCFDRPSGSSGIQGKDIPVEELVGYMLCYLKECAETYLTRKPIRKINRIDGSEVETTATATTTSTRTRTRTAAEGTLGSAAVLNRVVLGVPANFTEHSKKTLKKAAQLAGFQEVHFFVESTAAAAAYGLAVAGRKTVLVVDVGGGTTDLSVVHIDNGVFTVRATGGSNDLGGRNIDAALLELVLEKAAALPDRQTAERVSAVPRPALLRLCRDCKERLSSEETATISIPLGADNAVVWKADMVVTREEFERCISAVTDRLQATVRRMVDQYLAGHHSPNPSPSADPATEQTNNGEGAEGVERAVDAVEEEGFVTVHRESLTPSPALTPSPVTVEAGPAPASQPCPLPLLQTTTEGYDGWIQEVVLVGGSSRVPAVRAAIRRALGQAGVHHFGPTGAGELCTSLNPEEVVAEGLAIRGAVLSGVSAGKLRDLLVMDCLANALGVMSWEGPDHSCTQQRVFDAVLRKGAPLPAEGKMRFRLASPAQRFVSLDIYEEVEEVRMIKPTAQSGEMGNEPSSEDTAAKGRYETAYSYHVVATVDVPVPVLSGGAEDNTAVDVAFTMTSEGVLKFDVCRTGSTGQPGAGDSAEVKKAEEFSTTLLGIYAVLMIVVYALVKVALSHLHAAADTDGSSGHCSAGADGSGEGACVSFEL